MIRKPVKMKSVGKKSTRKSAQTPTSIATLIKRSIVGYKSNYIRCANRSKSEKVREAMMTAMDRWLDARRKELIKQYAKELSEDHAFFEKYMEQEQTGETK